MIQRTSKASQRSVVDFNPESECTATKLYYYDRLSDADDTNTGYKSDDK